MSDFHEMVNNLYAKDERSMHPRNPADLIDMGGRRLGIERRQFTYSLCVPERRLGAERRIIPERRVDARAESSHL